VASGVRTDATAEALKEVLGELEGIRKPLTAEELTKGRALVISDIVDAAARTSDAARTLADLALYGRPLNEWAMLPDQLGQLNVAGLTEAAGRLFPPRTTIVIWWAIARSSSRS
jgi:predicted Zn-dependent peptidase